MLKLIADSGSTKTDWAIAGNGIAEKRFQTSGLNPVVMGLERFEETVCRELLPEIAGFNIEEIEFYGAGCTVEACPKVKILFNKLIPSASNITVASDMLGAARAACGHHEGICAILGTGSNSCLYNGSTIAENTPALGFILGDEGSGAVLGRLFLNALLKGRLPKSIKDDFEAELALNTSLIIERVYRSAQPNKFLASLSPFIKKHSSEPSVREIIIDNFRAFLRNNIAPYHRTDLPVTCVGSMAYYYSEELKEAARCEGYDLGRILRSPIEGLL